MIFVPAIDLLGGHVVRLAKGDYGQVSTYGDDPLAQARAFEREGARRIHVVDLDGARDGVPGNADAIGAIARSTTLEVEVGGGVRTMETLGAYIAAGASRVVLGSALVRDRAFVEEAVSAYANNIVAGVDARDGMVAVEGWLEGTSVPAAELVAELGEMGISKLVYTDISRDGMQSGVDAAAYAELARIAGFPITASGGVSTLDDIRALAALSADGPGCEAVICGRAIFEGAFSVSEAIAAAGD